MRPLTTSRLFAIIAIVASTLVSRSIAQPPAAPSPAQLDAVLDHWEAAMRQISAVRGDLPADADVAAASSGSSEVFEGTIRFLKSNPPAVAASVEMHRKDNPSVTEKLLLNDRGLWQFDAAAKEVRLHPLPKAFVIGDNTLFALFAGLKAADAKKRFDIQLKGIDPNYIYIEVVPVLPRDKADFAKARLTLTRARLPAAAALDSAGEPGRGAVGPRPRRLH